MIGKAAAARCITKVSTMVTITRVTIRGTVPVEAEDLPRRPEVAV